MSSYAVKKSMEFPRIVQSPWFKNESKLLMKVFFDKSSFGGLNWSLVDVPDSSEDSLFVMGDLAKRMLGFLKAYTLFSKNYLRYVAKPDCHGAAMFCMGIVDFMKRISPSDSFKKIYSDYPVEFTYETQAPPVLVHLLRKELDPANMPDFHEANTPHSILSLGQILGEDICFEKQGNGRAKFSFVRRAEEDYSSKYRLYVKQGERFTD